ncbi:hypothetical protein CcaverHIS002_0409820 [Cutaneotrichosporon cavernicola]|uniref:GPI transamidase component PIG-S n=1 Tax=Cutaneotrichosporon cavernicola TaxID=279322 RepID=A0AA48L543_9TREE|nr:uncharacterized protein CcaverHIS019_0409740 [Cutaneotrichosporon cavernicola]BEI84378.1 hypothetical protein CcaverHIS002_0409820 [Cutaneotrichosporon cavernicola]BEI92154.1 hypothetical protein CcaverHIS019_0409740 [Cutaneotrichosporon cavernicola]BEI99924.1 hypothetical protein CcaverHIS631_0409670 [Cutaneotrichosporon cavernicola]BEJ07699.1 hypothetical protein CcaverHIS641_0409680 [Cutaneotrichosporon cavernicola]
MPEEDPPRDAAPLIAAINPTRTRRWAVMLCFPLFIALASPWWWATTSIVRLPLPVARIAALESQGDPVISTLISLTGNDAAFPKAPAGRADFPTATKLDALATEVIKGVDGMLGRDRPDVRGTRRWDMVTNGPKSASHRVHIEVSESAKADWPLEPYVQTSYGTADVQPGTVVIPIHPSMVSDLNLKRHYKIALVNAIHNLLPSHLPPLANRALAYSPNITLSFVVVNEDAADGAFVDGWDIDGALRDHILPHLEPLAPVFNFSVESQVLYHAPLAFEPTHDEEGWVVDEDGMKMFVSERWTLDSLSTNNPVLKFLLFVPSAQHAPLRLSANATSFLIPQFGSVVLLNPPAEAGAYTLSLDALDRPFKQFTEHLYGLLSLPALFDKLHPCPETVPKGGKTRAQRGLRDPLTVWQLDTILRVRMAENAAEGRKTLGGIVRLVDKIKEMQLGSGVRDKVLGAVRRLEELPDTAQDMSPLNAFVLSRDAVGLANEAFFDPSMMGLLYFPDQHKFAVYTPLFAPIGVSIVVGILREIVNILKRRKAARKTANEKKKVDERLDIGPEAESTGMTTAMDTPAAARLRTANTT